MNRSIRKAACLLFMKFSVRPTTSMDIYYYQAVERGSSDSLSTITEEVLYSCLSVFLIWTVLHDDRTVACASGVLSGWDTSWSYRPNLIGGEEALFESRRAAGNRWGGVYIQYLKVGRCRYLSHIIYYIIRAKS